jgi:DnaK suppressor protein
MAPTHLTPAQLNRFEERLQRERTRLLGLTQKTGRPEEMPGLADPSDAADLADEQMERSTQATLTATERTQLSHVNRALAKLEEGTYGVSDMSGEPIPLARLEALPWATNNVEDVTGR